MGKVTHDTIRITLEKPKQTIIKINDKGKYPVVKILKGAVGADGIDGGIYIPSFYNNTMFWTKEINIDNAPDSVNFSTFSFSVNKISNTEILNIVNNGD